MNELKRISIYGPKDPNDRGGIISFNIGDIHPHDLATILNDEAVAIRSGHHCAQVLMEKLDVSATYDVIIWDFAGQERYTLPY